MEVAERCYDDSSGIEEVLETITKVVLASQCSELEIVLFACELRMMNDYGFADGAVGSILEHPWSIDTLSTVADKLIEQHGTKPDYFPLQLILKLLDRVNRQDDATDYLRSVAEQRIENAKDYYGAVDCLKRMKTALEKDHRLADWDDVIAEIRTVHSRKRNLLQLLDELQGKSIVREKRQKM